MITMKYEKKQRSLYTEKMTKNQVLIYMLWVIQSRGQAEELKQTVNRLCTYPPADYVYG